MTSPHHIPRKSSSSGCMSNFAIVSETVISGGRLKKDQEYDVIGLQPEIQQGGCLVQIVTVHRSEFIDSTLFNIC